MENRFILGIGAALLVIFASTRFLLFTWENTLGYFLTVILASFLGGTLIVDFERSLKTVTITFIAGFFLFMLLYLLPTLIFGELYSGEVNYRIAVITTSYSRVVIVSFPVAVFSCLFGCFLGKSLAQRE